MTTADENPAPVSDECGVCGRHLGPDATTIYSHRTGITRCKGCEFLPVPQSGRYEEIISMPDADLRRQAERGDLSDADRWLIDDEMAGRALADGTLEDGT
jgi:hypothetical protein